MLREVARRGTIAAAADHLGYTPSAVSQQLSSAEKVTGIAFLERVGRNVALTDAGRELVTHADIVLNQLEHAQIAIERVQGAVAGILRLGFIESISSTLLGPIMSKIRSDHPDLALRTMAIDPFWPADLIQSGDLDIAFAVGSANSPNPLPDGCARTMICRDWLRIVMPVATCANKRRPKALRLESLKGHDIIAPPATDSYGQAAFQACADAGLDPFVAHRVADYPTTLRLVGAGAGVALVPDLGLQNVPDDVEVFDLAEPAHRTIELLYRRSSAERPAMRALIQVVQDVAATMDLDLFL